jgi:ribosome-associated heat shock protein Hsp15
VDRDMSGEAPAPVQRLDKWLWFARVLKSRTMAAEFVERGRVRVNRVRVIKPSHTLREGDVLTISLRGQVLVLKVLGLGARRGPPPEARLLYQRLDDNAGQSADGNATGRRDGVSARRIGRTLRAKHK